MRTKAWTAVACLALLLTGCGTTKSVHAQADANASPAPAKPEYRILQDRPDRLLVELPNRMIVIVQELHTSPVVSTQVWIKTGSIFEQEHVGAGLSHYLEHLLSGGTTKNRTEAESNVILGRIGAQTNASTSLDEVRYYINTTSSHTSTAVDLLSDWMQNSLISETEFKREHDVILREFEMGRGEPDRIFWKLTQQARYVAHPARHPTIGYVEEFNKITRDEIYDFYRRMYVPNNMVFVVVGDVDRHKVADQIADLWKNAKPGELPDLSFPVEPEITAPRQMTGSASVRRPQLRLAWPGTRMGGEGDYALDLLGNILGQGEASRLVQTVRDEQQLVTTIEAYNLSFPWGSGFFGIDAEVAVAPGAPESDVANAIGRTESALLKEVLRIRTQGVTDEELARAKRQTVARVLMAGQTAEGLAGRVAGDVIGMGDPDYMRHYADAIQKVTRGQIAAAADRFLADNRLITIKLLPASPDAKPEDLARPVEDAAAADLKREPFLLDNIVLLDRLRTLSRDAGGARAVETDAVEMYTLPNGLRVLLGRSTVVPAVAVQMYHLGGLLADEPGKQGLTNAMSSMRMRGTKTRTAQQIAERIEQLGANMDTSCGNNSEMTMATCLREDLPAILELFADVELNPSFPDDEWSKLQQRLVAAIERQSDTWDREMGMLFRETYFKGHPWSTTSLGVRDYVASLKASDLRDYHAARLGANEAVLAIFGDFDKAAVMKQVESLFGSMPAKATQPFKVPEPVSPAPTVMEQKTNKPLAAVLIGFGPGVTRSSPDYAALQVLSRVMSSFPSGWLEQELRGKGEGLVYASWAFQFTGMSPGYFALGFNSNPEKMTTALEKAMGVVERARTERISDEDLARAKARLLTSEFMGKQSNSDRATDAALNVLYGLGLDEPKKYLETVQALDADILKVIAETHLRNPVGAVLTFKPVDEKVLRETMKIEEK